MGLDPMTWAIIGASSLGAVGSVVQGREEAQQAKAQGALQIESAAKRAKQLSLQNSRLLEQQRSSFLRTGTELSGSAFNVLTQTTATGMADLQEAQLDINRMRNYYEKSASNSVRQGLFGGASSLAIGGMNAYNYQTGLAGSNSFSSSSGILNGKKYTSELEFSPTGSFARL